MQLFFWISALILSLAAGYAVYARDRKRNIPQPWLPALLRTVLVMLTLLLLVAPLITIDKTKIRQPVILFLQDNTSSFPIALKNDTTAYRQKATNLLDKLADDYRVVHWGFGSRVQPDSLFRYEQSATDISGALSQAVAYYGQQNLGAIILASDGRYNQGVNPQYASLPYNGYLYAIAPGDSAPPKDIRISRVYANKTVSLHSQFEIRADMIADQCNGYREQVRLQEVNGSASEATMVSVNSDKFSHTVSFILQASRVGLHHYRITVPPAADEENTTNNSRDIFVEVVQEQKNILIAAAAPHPDIRTIREALAGMDGYVLTVSTGDKLPADLSAYDILILHGLPSAQYPLRSLQAGKKPLWLIMAGGAANATYNQLQQMVALNVNTNNLQPFFPAPVAAFPLFSLPPNIQLVLDRMPPLAVPAGTIQTRTNAGTHVLLEAKGDTRMPLWIFEQGTVPAALLTGEGLWRWSLAAYRHFQSHQAVHDLIRQTVAFLAAHTGDKPFHIFMPKYVWSDQEAVMLNGELRNASNEQINTPDVTVTIRDNAGDTRNYPLARSGSTYRLHIGLLAAGSYSYTATVTYNGETYTDKGSFAVQHTPLEMMETGADYPLLHALSRQQGGQLFSVANMEALYDTIRHNAHIRPVIETAPESFPLIDRKWYFFLILSIAVAEWLIRKYRMAQ